MYTFLLILVTIIWGSTFFIIKDTVLTVNPFFIVFGRTMIAAVSMGLFLLFTGRIRLLDQRSIIRGSILGLLMAVIYSSQTIGLKYTSSGHSAFVTGAAVVIVPLLLFFFFRQKLTTPSVLSVIIVFSGLFLLTYDLETKVNVGDMITLITALALSFHTILAGRFVRQSDVYTLVTFQFLAASLASLAVFYMTGNQVILPGNLQIGAIVYLGFIGTLVCYFITVWVQKYVSSVKVALTFSLEPVFAAFFGYLALDEILNIRELTGALLILTGLIGYQLIKIRFKFES